MCVIHVSHEYMTVKGSHCLSYPMGFKDGKKLLENPTLTLKYSHMLWFKTLKLDMFLWNTTFMPSCNLALKRVM